MLNETLKHHGIKGQKWGVRRYQNIDGSLTNDGKNRYYGQKVFISGTSKMQDKESPYYRKELPQKVTNKIDGYIKKNEKIIVGDAPGVDSMVQDYLFSKKYKNVDIYCTGKDVRKNSDSERKLNWKVKKIDGGKFTVGSKEWHEAKDIAMSKVATKGLAIILENGGASATRKNIDRLIADQKDISIFELYANVKKCDDWLSVKAYSNQKENK